MASAPRTRRNWTSEEDNRLRREVEIQSSSGSASDWKAVAEKIAGRTNKDCRKRWNKIQACITKGPWSASEDEKLRQAVEKHGLKWMDVCREVGSRNSDQCAKRWHYAVDPSVDRSMWRSEEDEVLLAAVDRHGQAWRTISEHFFPKRATTDIKNRYVIITRNRRKSQPSSMKTPESLDSPGSGSTDSDDDLDYSLFTNETREPSPQRGLPTPAMQDCMPGDANNWLATTMDLDLSHLPATNDMMFNDPPISGWDETTMLLDADWHMSDVPDKSSLAWNTSKYSDMNLSLLDPLLGDITEPHAAAAAPGGSRESPPAPPAGDVSSATAEEVADKSSRSQIKLVLDNANPSSLNAIVNVLLENNMNFRMEAAS